MILAVCSEASTLAGPPVTHFKLPSVLAAYPSPINSQDVDATRIQAVHDVSAVLRSCSLLRSGFICCKCPSYVALKYGSTEDPTVTGLP